MRRYTIAAVLVLLLLGLAGGAWLLLNPSDHAAPVAPALNETATAPRQSSNALDVPVRRPAGNAAPESTVDPAPEPDVDPAAEIPKPTTTTIIGRVVDSLTGEPPSSYVYVSLTSHADGSWADQYTYAAADGTFTFALGEQTLPADALLTTQSPGYWPGSQTVADTNIIRLVRAIVADAPVEGAELRVIVIGPDSQPLPGVFIWVDSTGGEHLRAHTGPAGDVLLTGIAAPSSWTVRLRDVNGTQLIAENQQVEFASLADRKDVRFDLTGTGIVDYEFTVNGTKLQNITLKAADAAGSPRIRREWPVPDTADPKLIYGLSPGKYIVTAAGWVSPGGYLEFVGLYEVVQPPAVSTWRRDYKTSTVTVRVNGADGNDLKLSWMSGGVFPVYEVAPQPGGEFVIEGLGARALTMRVHGDGWASDVLVVYPSVQPDVQVDVFAAGSLKLTARCSLENCSIKIVGVDPVRRAVLVQCPRFGNPDALELPPGLYRVEQASGQNAPWDPIEVTVKAGEQAEFSYGPEFTSRLRIPEQHGTWLDAYTVTLEQDGQPVKTSRQDHREYFCLAFEAEGKLTLRIKGDGIEDFEREFEVQRGGTVTLEIDLKQKN